MATKIRPEDAAKILGISPQAVRVGLQQGTLPFGWAIKLSESRFTYAISPKLFHQYLIEKENEHEPVENL